MSKHVFAFYKENISKLIKDNHLELKDKTLWQRLTKVTRLKSGEELILFDDKINIKCSLNKESLSNNLVSVKISNQSNNESINPKIILLMPIIKKDQFEYVTYVAAQLGITEIIPIETEKTKKNFLNDKEYDRLKKIMISACEQSKNFVPPKLASFKKLKDLEIPQSLKICFLEEGPNLHHELGKKVQNITLILGAEGGLTKNEIDFLKQNNFEFRKLSSTILRSQEAAIIGMGIVRSLTS